MQQRILGAAGLLLGAALGALLPVRAEPPARAVENQPLAAQALRVVDTLDYLGAPLSPADRKAVVEAARNVTPESTGRIQQVLDRYCLFQVQINPESRV